LIYSILSKDYEMTYLPKSITRFGHRHLLKLQKNSPTILVVGGVVGLTASAVLAAKATRNIDPILEDHAKGRLEVSETVFRSQSEEQRELVLLYADTTWKFARLYGPSIAVGAISAGSILHGHKILKGRHLATMAAYTGLMEQYQAYRSRVAETLGTELEREIHDGGVGVWEEDPDRPGEHKRKVVHAGTPANYLRPFFDESNPNWTTDPASNFYFLKGVQAHMNRILDIRGHLFLFEVYDALGIPRTPEVIVAGWLADGDGDNFVDFGFMASQDPQAIMFRNGGERSVRLNFNIDGVIWDLI
jgi:hypothetical protein